MKKTLLITAATLAIAVVGCQPFRAERSVPGTSFSKLQVDLTNGVPRLIIEKWDSKKDFNVHYNPKTGEVRFADVMNPSNTVAGGNANAEALQVSGQNAVQLVASMAQLATSVAQLMAQMQVLMSTAGVGGVVPPVKPISEVPTK